MEKKLSNKYEVYVVKNGLLRTSAQGKKGQDPRDWVRGGRFIRESPRELSGGGSIPIDSGN